MASVDDRLAAWRDRVGRCVQAGEDALLSTVVASGTIGPDELRGLLSVIDYRALVNDLGRALRLKPHTLAFCELIGAGIAVFHSGVRLCARQLWRHAIGHAMYALVTLLEPLILLRRGFVTVVCSRRFVELGLRFRRKLRGFTLGVSNFTFEILVSIAVAPVAVAALKWFYMRVWPLVAVVMRRLHTIASIAVLLCRLAAVNAWGLTVLRVTIALARRRNLLRCTSAGNRADPEPRISMRVANALLRRDPDAARSRTVGEELWVDVFPAGPLFATMERNRIMELWERVDASSHIDMRTYEEILGSLGYPASEILAAVRQITRPPRPLLSAVIVATGLRMGLAGRLAKLQRPRLRRETSRWKFFARGRVLHHGPRKYIVLTPLNDYAHQKPRIIAGKLVARIIEVILGHSDGLYFHFVFALPACRPRTAGSISKHLLTVAGMFGRVTPGSAIAWFCSSPR